MNYIISRHALEQLKNRNIPERCVQDVIENPEKVIEYDACIKIYQAKIRLEKTFLLRVFVNTCKEPEVVITVYKTTKIEKYHEG